MNFLLMALLSLLGIGGMSAGSSILDAFLVGPKLAKTQAGLMAKKFAMDRETAMLTSKALGAENEQLLAARRGELSRNRAQELENFQLQAQQTREQGMREMLAALAQQTMAGAFQPTQYPSLPDPSSVASVMRWQG